MNAQRAGTALACWPDSTLGEEITLQVHAVETCLRKTELAP